MDATEVSDSIPRGFDWGDLAKWGLITLSGVLGFWLIFLIIAAVVIGDDWGDDVVCSEFSGINFTEEKVNCRLVDCVRVETDFDTPVERCACESTGTMMYRYCSERLVAKKFVKGKELEAWLGKLS